MRRRLIWLAGGVLFPSIPWDFGAIADNIEYMALYMLADIIWRGHAVLFAIARFLTLASNVVSTQLLPAAVDAVVQVVGQSNIFVLMMTLAFVLLGVGYIARPFLDIRMVSLKRLLLFSVITLAVFSYGSDVTDTVEEARIGLARSIHNVAYSSFYNNAQWRGVPGQMAIGGAESTMTLRDFYEAGYTSYDVAMSALYLQSNGEELLPFLPPSFAQTFFPYPSIAEGLDSAQRTEALNQAIRGVGRLVWTYVITGNSVFDALIQLLLSFAAGFILVSLPVALLFSVFLPMETAAVSLIKMYLSLIYRSVAVYVFTAIGLSGIITAAETGSVVPVIGATAIALFIDLYAAKVAFTAVKEAMTGFGAAMAISLGVRGGPEQEAAAMLRTATGVALGLAGAGLVAAAPAFAGSLLSGVTSIAGGTMLRRSPFSQAAGAVLSAKAFGVGDGGIANTLREGDPASLALAGMYAGNNPYALYLAMNRMTQRAQRLRRGTDATLPPAARQPSPSPRRPLSPDEDVGYTPRAASPWGDSIRRAEARFGRGWTRQIAAAVDAVIASYRNAGLDDKEIARRFADANGYPSIASEGGRMVFNRLPDGMKSTLTEQEAREALRGIIGDRLATPAAFDTDAIAAAVARAVQQGVSDGARAVADHLSISPAGIGGYYGPIRHFVSLAQQLNLNGEVVQRLVLSAAGGKAVPEAVVSAIRQAGVSASDTTRIVRAAQLLPRQIVGVSAQIAPGTNPQEEAA